MSILRSANFLFCLASVSSLLLINAQDKKKYCSYNATAQFVNCEKFTTLDEVNLREVDGFSKESKILKFRLAPEPAAKVTFSDTPKLNLDMYDFLGEYFVEKFDVVLEHFSGLEYANKLISVINLQANKLTIDNCQVKFTNSSASSSSSSVSSKTVKQEENENVCDAQSVDNDLFNPYVTVEFGENNQYRSSICPHAFEYTRVQHLIVHGSKEKNCISFTNTSTKIDNKLEQYQLLNSELRSLGPDRLPKVNFFHSLKEFVYHTSPSNEQVLFIAPDESLNARQPFKISIELNNMAAFMTQESSTTTALDWITKQATKQFYFVTFKDLATEEPYSFDDEGFCTFKNLNQDNSEEKKPFIDFDVDELNCTCSLRYAVMSRPQIKLDDNVTLTCDNESSEKCDFDAKLAACRALEPSTTTLETHGPVLNYTETPITVLITTTLETYGPVLHRTEAPIPESNTNTIVFIVIGAFSAILFVILVTIYLKNRSELNKRKVRAAAGTLSMENPSSFR